MRKNFRKRSFEPDSDDEEDVRRDALEEIKYVQKLRERKHGIPAASGATTDGSSARGRGGGGAAGPSKVDNEEPLLQDTFEPESTVAIEDPNMLRYVENELLKKSGKTIEMNEDEKDQVDELFVVPDQLKGMKTTEGILTQWTTGIAEVHLPIEYKIRNIEETEAATKLLRQRRLAGKTESDAEKLRRDRRELQKGQDSQANETGGKATNSNNSDGPPAGRREVATDELMFERFSKREKFREKRRKQ